MTKAIDRAKSRREKVLLRALWLASKKLADAISAYDNCSLGPCEGCDSRYGSCANQISAHFLREAEEGACRRTVKTNSGTR